MIIMNLRGEVICDSERVLLKNQELRDADFRRKNLHGLGLDGTDLRGVDFSDSQLYMVHLFLANCESCNFQRTRLRGTVLDESNFQYADFTDAVFERDSLLLPTTMLGTNLANATFNGAQFHGCQYDRATVFPASFDPVSAGLEPVVE